jgi:predicted alpha-1,2-mannosidase
MMSKLLGWGLVAASVLGGVAMLAQKPSPIDWVNVRIGTGSGAIGYGGSMPFVVPPFGMTDWTAQTRQNRLSVVSYKDDDKTISGFMGTHQPAIWMGDYGYVTLMPEVDGLKTTPEERALKFTHADEVARPDYYSVKMDAGAGRVLRTEMTATSRCALMRFTFPAGADGTVMVEASRPGVKGYAEVDAGRREIRGYNPDRTDKILGPFALPHFKGYFVVEFREGFAGSTYGGDGKATGAWAKFGAGQGRAIEARVGTSFLSVEQARANLRSEIPGWDFDVVRRETAAKWNAKLGMVSVEGATEGQRAEVYTALYHALLYPREFSEGGRYYSAFDDAVHEGESYTAYSIWDTFRAEFSLQTLLAPERVDGMITALLQNYKEGGWMPKWPNPSYTNIMIGTHADSLVAEAMGKGFHGFDHDTAWNAVLKDAMTPPEGDTTRRWYDREPHTPYEARGGLTYAKVLGFVPNDKTAESASRTLEDAYDDWCVAQVAKSLGKMDEYEFFLKRSLNYEHVFNPKTGFMQAKNSDGSWAGENEGWTEGDHWVYTFAVLQDEPGLMALMGGAEKYNALLDEHFAGGHNVHKNEPSHHYGYLYDYSGEPWKTQAKVREIAAAEYADAPAGLDGDDDCGQMSAWYLFTAMGFYPVNPASGEYLIGSPLFSKMTLKVSGGKTFSVVAVNNSDANVYIQSATLNGVGLEVPVISYREIVRGGTLRFVMGATPSKWGAGWKPASVREMMAAK